MIDIRDGDDLNPTFTKELYQTRIQEDYPITVGKRQVLLLLVIPTHAYQDQRQENFSAKLPLDAAAAASSLSTLPEVVFCLVRNVEKILNPNLRYNPIRINHIQLFFP